MFEYGAEGQESGVAKGLFCWLLGVLFSSMESSMFVRVSLIPVFLNIVFFTLHHCSNLFLILYTGNEGSAPVSHCLFLDTCSSGVN